MSNIDKRALREAAEKATPGPWVEKRGEVTTADYEVEGATYLDHICNCEIVGTESPNAEFIAAANPATVLALLDELEVKDKSISFLKDQLAQLANFNPDWDKLEAATDSLREHMAKLSSAEKRIELLTLELNVLKGGCE